MRREKHGLFTQVTGPLWLNFLNIFISVLSVPFSINIITLSRLQGRIPVALNFQVRVRNDYRTLRMIEMRHRSRYQKVAQLHFEQLSFLVKEKERAIDRLYHDHGLLIGPEVTDHKVVGIPFKVERVDFLIRRKCIVMHYQGNCQLPGVQHADGDGALRIGPLEVLLSYFGAYQFCGTIDL